VGGYKSDYDLLVVVNHEELTDLAECWGPADEHLLREYQTTHGISAPANWRKTSRENREYLSVKLDDPSFVSPIYASLVDGEEGCSLVWARSRSAD
jgi:hypothetical protein